MSVSRVIKTFNFSSSRVRRRNSLTLHNFSQPSLRNSEICFWVPRKKISANFFFPCSLTLITCNKNKNIYNDGKELFFSLLGRKILHVKCIATCCVCVCEAALKKRFVEHVLLRFLFSFPPIFFSPSPPLSTLICFTLKLSSKKKKNLEKKALKNFSSLKILICICSKAISEKNLLHAFCGLNSPQFTCWRGGKGGLKMHEGGIIITKWKSKSTMWVREGGESFFTLRIKFQN